MDFALFYEIPVPKPWTPTSEHEAYRNTIEQAVWGEQAGFSSFWTVEHHFLDEYSHCSAPDALYGAIAAKTSRLRIGHGVRLLPKPYNHPIRAAEAAAVVDLVTDGRLEFGTGRSSTRAELEGFGADPNLTRAQWEEALRMIVGAWTEDPFEWDGEFWQMPARRVHPKPLQQPHPPLWAASSSEPSHVLAGELGLGLLSFTIGVPPEELANRIALYRDALRRARPVGTFVNGRAATFTMVHCADTTEKAFEEARDSFEWYVRTALWHIGTVASWLEGKPLGTYDYAEILKDLDLSLLTFDYLESSGSCIVGDPERCLEVAERYRAAGCDLLLCLVNPYAIPHRSVMRSIELLGERVIPHFRQPAI
jgi:alkanesulfonate monooxygenase SsuD/methylene tetrahydromethanopterin reductase-like flavin-dependent oxidoreductase (luciferase family)